MTRVDPILGARGVSKAFFGNPVLRGVSIDLLPGRIHALLGENGAGKSTLINILSGALQPDAGELIVEGRSIKGLSPGEARGLGIAVVQQELSLAPHLSIAENIALGAEPIRLGVIDYSTLARDVAGVCEQIALDEPLDKPVGELPLGRRQSVEIAKALYRRPRVLVLDEPTSSLSSHDVTILMDLVRRLRDQRVAILYISHRLNEILNFCDYVTVLKDGTVTADRPLQGLDPAGLVKLMVGRDPKDLFPPYVNSTRDEVALEVKNFRAMTVSEVTLSLKRGEICGIGGLVGQGQEDFLLGLYGAVPATADSFVVDGDLGTTASSPITRVVDANRAGIAYVPADRKKEALLLQHAISFNLLLPLFARRWLRRRTRRAENFIAASLANRFSIRGDLGRAVLALSGGNQQKVALAKWLPLTPTILLLNDPTRGVDVETKREIYLVLRGMAADGTAILLASSDTPELTHLCDRVMVFVKGRVQSVLYHEEATEEAIVAAALEIHGEAGDP